MKMKWMQIRRALIYYGHYDAYMGYHIIKVRYKSGDTEAFSYYDISEKDRSRAKVGAEIYVTKGMYDDKAGQRYRIEALHFQPMLGSLER